MPISRAQLVSLAAEMNDLLEDRDKFKEFIKITKIEDVETRDIAIEEFVARHGFSEFFERMIKRIFYPGPGPIWLMPIPFGPDDILLTRPFPKEDLIE